MSSWSLQWFDHVVVFTIGTSTSPRTASINDDDVTPEPETDSLLAQFYPTTIESNEHRPNCYSHKVFASKYVGSLRLMQFIQLLFYCIRPIRSLSFCTVAIVCAIVRQVSSTVVTAIDWRHTVYSDHAFKLQRLRV